MSKDIREQINKIKNFGQFLSERVNINSIKNNIIVLTNNLDKYGGTILLFNTETKLPVGYIGFGYVENGDVFSIGGIYSENGYGALLYEMAMTWVYPNGIAPSQDGGTSDSARIVWEKFEIRDDVKKSKINRIKLSDKEEDLINGCDGNRECLDIVKKQIDLHNVKFSYSFGIDKLNKLIKIGDEYKVKYKITNTDIEYMTYDLE